MAIEYSFPYTELIERILHIFPYDRYYKKHIQFNGKIWITIILQKHMQHAFGAAYNIYNIFILNKLQITLSKFS